MYIAYAIGAIKLTRNLTTNLNFCEMEKVFLIIIY